MFRRIWVWLFRSTLLTRIAILDLARLHVTAQVWYYQKEVPSSQIENCGTYNQVIIQIIRSFKDYAIYTVFDHLLDSIIRFSFESRYASNLIAQTGTPQPNKSTIFIGKSMPELLVCKLIPRSAHAKRRG